MSAALDIPKQAEQWTVANFTVGLPQIQRDFAKKTVNLDPNSLEEGQVLVKVAYVSVDPYQRMFLTPAGGRALGEVVLGSSAGVVLASKNPKFPVGSHVEGTLGWVSAAVLDPEQVKLRILAQGLDLGHSVGVLGVTGATAMYGVEEILKPEPQHTVFVSGAAGAVGNLVGQICKALGCRVFGSAGSDEKVKQLLELGFDGALNYSGKTAQQLISEIEQLTGEKGAGIDRYFDNTGGPVTGAVFSLLNRFARVALCGQISQYNLKPEDLLNGSAAGQPANLLMQAVSKSTTIQGFMLHDCPDLNPHLLKLQDLIQSNKVQVLQTVVEGFDNVPEAFLGLFEGSNRGKLVVKL